MSSVFRWWLVPAVASALAAPLLAAALQTPHKESPLLAVAILGALPWSLVLMLVDLAPGFASRAGLVVAAGLAINLALLWGLCIAWRRRRARRDRGGA